MVVKDCKMCVFLCCVVAAMRAGGYIVMAGVPTKYMFDLQPGNTGAQLTVGGLPVTPI